MKERHLKRILIALASALLYAQAAHAGGLTASPTPTRLPEITYFDASGEKTFTPGKAKLTVLHFWAMWCVPCIKELPELAQVAKDFAPHGLVVMPLAADGANREKVEQFYKDKGLDLPYYSDHKSTAANPLKVNFVPYSIFVNEKGEEIARIRGTLRWTAPQVADFLKENLK